MRNAIRRAPTKTVCLKKREMELPSSEQMVWMVYFATASLIGLIALEVIYMGWAFNAEHPHRILLYH